MQTIDIEQATGVLARRYAPERMKEPRRAMIRIEPATLEGDGVRLEPLTPEHGHGLREAVSDGRLWELWYTAVPEPGEVGAYIAAALDGLKARRHAAVGGPRPEERRDRRHHPLSRHLRRHRSRGDRPHVVRARWQRTHVNTTCKLLLFQHAFDTLGCRVVGLRTDNFNFRSQRAIEGLGAKKDGVLRHHKRRRDGTVRDSVMYSVLAPEWPDVKRHLRLRLDRHAGSSS